MENQGLNIKAIQKLLKGQRYKRPILASLLYQNNRIVFSNSYSLGIYKFSNNLENEININVFTSLITRGDYPKLDRIIPINYSKVTSLGSSVSGDVISYIVNFDNDFVFDFNLSNDTMNCFTRLAKMKNVKTLMNLFELKKDCFYISENKQILIFEDEDIKFIVLGVNNK